MWSINPRISMICLVLALGACDKSEPEVVIAPTAVAPVAEPVVEEVAPAPVTESVLDQPEVSSKTAKVTPAKKPTPAANVRPEPEVFEVPRLDLSVSQELLDALELGQPLPPEPLLPPLLGREAAQDFRLNGRLIMSDEEDRMFDGAELRLEFKN